MEIRDTAQLEKAKLEDLLVEILYSRYPKLVLHGGTAIWRCYSGNRFSRDIDFYTESKTPAEKMLHYKEISKFLQGYGFVLKEKGYSSSIDAMHFTVELAGTKMKVDINFRYKKGTMVDYTKLDGGIIAVLSLSPIELLNEKIEAYMDKLDNYAKFRHPEAHDLYDIWYLVSLIKKANPETVKRLNKLIGRIENNPPSDMSSLGHLIIAGLAPSFELMIKSIKRWIDEHS